ncbi:MAG: Rieske 2Fe-2S domain-containing protein [Heteroscytonema crispum UTEX LB 1556]
MLQRTVLGEWLAVFPGDRGQLVILRDRCIHKNSHLSHGKICIGKL